MAAKPNEPPMPALRMWIEELKQAIEQDDRAAIEEVLKDAIPEFGSISAIETTARADFVPTIFRNIALL